MWHTYLRLRASRTVRKKVFVVYKPPSLYFCYSSPTKTIDSANLTNLYPLTDLTVYGIYRFFFILEKNLEKNHMSHFNILTWKFRNKYIIVYIYLTL